MNKTFLYNQVGAVKDIISMYTSGKHMTQDIANKYHVTTRTIQRLMKQHGLIRSLADGNRNASQYRNYEALRVPEHLKSKRKTLSRKVRYELLIKYKDCQVCHNNNQLQVDHIDGNPENNTHTNLQVLCILCNQGKR